MTIQEFLSVLHDELDIESIEQFTEKTDLQSLEEWDSMTSMIFTAFIEDNFNINIDQEQIKNFKNIAEIIDFIGRENFPK